MMATYKNWLMLGMIHTVITPYFWLAAQPTVHIRLINAKYI